MKRMITRFDRSLAHGVLLCCVLHAVGCATGKYVWIHDREPDPVTSINRVVIGPGDEIEIRIYGDEANSVTGRVLADGTITMPLLGAVPVAGKRPEELAALLEPQLKRYITEPKVTVLIKESVVSVSVIGEVKAGGALELVAPATVLEALAKAGGLTEFADTSGIFVLRTRSDRTERIRFSYDALVHAEAAASRFQLKSGDVVVVE